MLDVAKIDVSVPPSRTADDIQIGALIATCDSTQRSPSCSSTTATPCVPATTSPR